MANKEAVEPDEDLENVRKFEHWIVEKCILQKIFRKDVIPDDRSKVLTFKSEGDIQKC